MNDFERVYQTDADRELDHPRELHPSIELSYAELAERFRDRCKKAMESWQNDLMLMAMPVLEEVIRKGNDNAKVKSKTTKAKAKKGVNKKTKEKM